MKTNDQTKMILKKRARQIAEESHIEEKKQEKIEVVEFQIGTERYGIESMFISKVQALDNLTSLPGLPDFMVGVINVHGNIIPVIDIGKFFDLTMTIKGKTGSRKSIILKTQNETIAILVDEVFGVIEIPIKNVQTTLPMLTGRRADFLKGVTLSQMAILDPNKLCKDKRIQFEHEL